MARPRPGARGPYVRGSCDQVLRQRRRPGSRIRQTGRATPQSHLIHFSGVRKTDAYVGYNAIFTDGRVREVACMAHVKLEIHDLHAHRATVMTTGVLRRIRELYAIEAQIRG